jgi:hypothetical protein
MTMRRVVDSVCSTVTEGHLWVRGAERRRGTGAVALDHTLDAVPAPPSAPGGPAACRARRLSRAPAAAGPALASAFDSFVNVTSEFINSERSPAPADNLRSRPPAGVPRPSGMALVATFEE